MSAAFDALKNIPVAEKSVELAGQKLVVIGLTRSRKAEITADCTSRKTGRIDNALLESKYLACCVCDSTTREPIQPDFREWNLSSHVVAPLVAACVEVNGLDEEEATALLKKSESAQSTDSSGG